MRTLAVIPARWGSRGIPHKNFRTLGGRSLIRLAVDCALEAGCDRVIVTTDRPDRVGPLPLGVFVRQTPMALAGDRHQVPALIRDAILGFFDEPSDRLVYLQPSQPFRRVADVRRTIQACTWAVDGAATVVPCPEARTAARILRRELAWLLLPNEQRQRASPTYRLDGTCYVWRREWAGLLTDHIRPVLVDPRHSCVLDTLSDWALVRQRWRRRAGVRSSRRAR